MDGGCEREGGRERERERKGGRERERGVAHPRHLAAVRLRFPEQLLDVRGAGVQLVLPEPLLFLRVAQLPLGGVERDLQEGRY